MPKVTYLGIDGHPKLVAAESGQSVMQTAVDANLSGIVAECGGNMSCGTCHVFVDEAWADRLEAAEDEELEMLEFLDAREPTSRLSCQIELTEELDGLVVRTPESQDGI
jgi:2Fe-2S ferredoxin